MRALSPHSGWHSQTIKDLRNSRDVNLVYSTVIFGCSSGRLLRAIYGTRPRGRGLGISHTSLCTIALARKQQRGGHSRFSLCILIVANGAASALVIERVRGSAEEKEPLDDRGGEHALAADSKQSKLAVIEKSGVSCSDSNLQRRSDFGYQVL